MAYRHAAAVDGYRFHAICTRQQSADAGDPVANLTVSTPVTGFGLDISKVHYINYVSTCYSLYNIFQGAKRNSLGGELPEQVCSGRTVNEAGRVTKLFEKSILCEADNGDIVRELTYGVVVEHVRVDYYDCRIDFPNIAAWQSLRNSRCTLQE